MKIETMRMNDELNAVTVQMTVGELVKIITGHSIDRNTIVTAKLSKDSDWPMAIDAIKINGYDGVATVGHMWTEDDGGPASTNFVRIINNSYNDGDDMIASSRMTTFISALTDIIGRTGTTVDAAVMVQCTVRNTCIPHSNRVTEIVTWNTVTGADWITDYNGDEILTLYIG